MKKPLGLYIHIPFCVQKCQYCDFLSFGGSSYEQRQGYTEALIREIQEAASAEYLVDSIFLGGGTPSLLEPELMTGILEAVSASFAVAAGAEITTEANPGTLTEEKLQTYRRAGINRLSLGLQTTDNGLLSRIGRIHTYEQFGANYELARAMGFDNINVDLIFALEGQSLASWQETLDTVLALAPEHLSFYSLQIEEGTPFYEKFKNGQLQQVSDEEDRRMYHTALEQLQRCGYIHYEISNAAKPGRECRHNLKYWSLADYLGLGLGAHSYLSGVRFANPSTLDDYLRGNGPAWVHKNDRRDSLTDYLFTGLRKRAGISLADFQHRYGQPISEIYGRQLATLSAEGLITLTEKSLMLSDLGLDLANQVLVAFMDPLA